MGKQNLPVKKDAVPPVQRQELEGGKTMTPPNFFLSSGPGSIAGNLLGSLGSAAEWLGKKTGLIDEEPATKVAPPAPEEVKKAAPVEAKPKDAQEGKAAKAAGLTEYELTKKNATVTTKDKERKTIEYEGTDLTTLMLKAAGYETPSAWYGDFTDISLFGLTAKSLHRSFANLLKNAEARTIEKIVAADDYKAWVTQTGAKNPESAKTVGKFMGLKGGYSTTRIEAPSSASMHIFGLAIDFNVEQNPWISDSAGKMDKYDKKKKTMVRDKTGVLQDMLDRAGGLMGQSLKYAHVNPDHFNYDMAETYDNFHKLDKGVEQYFGMGLDTKDAELKAFLDTTEDPFWKGKTTTEAREIINQDLYVMSEWWARKGKKKMEALRTNGIMDLDRRLVMSMGEVGLDWGGKYGDMMHFDSRNAGVGKKIQKAKRDAEVVAKKKELGG